MESAKQNTIRHWLVVASCCGLAASSIGICLNSGGVFFSPVAAELGVGRGDIALHTTLGSLVAGFLSPAIARFMEKYSIKPLLLFGIILAAISTGLMSLANSVWMFYVLGIIRGIGTACFSLMPVTAIIGNWFEKRHGLAVGIALSFSGLSGAIFNPIINNLIINVGWRETYVFTAIFVAVLALPALFCVSLKPSDCGLLPYGATKPLEKKNSSIEKKKVSFVSLSFIFLGIFTLLHTGVSSFAQHFTGFAETVGLGTQIGATMVSMGMIGNIISKLLIGVISDRVGAFKACIIMVGINAVSFAALCLVGADSTVIALGAAFLYGTVYSVGAVGIPLITRQVFGIEGYASAYSVLTILTSVGSASSLTIIGYVYDISGSYLPALIGCGLIDVVNLGILIFLFFRFKNKKVNS